MFSEDAVYVLAVGMLAYRHELAERELAKQRNLAAFGQQPEQPISIEFISDAVSAAQE